MNKMLICFKFCEYSLDTKDNSVCFFFISGSCELVMDSVSALLT